MIQIGIVASRGTDDQASAARTSLESAWPPSRRQLNSTNHAPTYRQNSPSRRPEHDSDQ